MWFKIDVFGRSGGLLGSFYCAGEQEASEVEAIFASLPRVSMTIREPARVVPLHYIEVDLMCMDAACGVQYGRA